MTRSAAAMSSTYIEWAKLHSHARYNLANSGVMNYPLAELGVRIEDLEISGPSYYGYEPLLQALARKCGVAKECVVAAVGTSQANHLAMAACVEPGDEVLIEHPAYDTMLGVAHHLGAVVKRFPRRAENGWRIGAAEVERLATARTRLIVLTNLHNPSGALTDEATLHALGEIARRTGARVLVDEVYLELLAVQQPAFGNGGFHPPESGRMDTPQLSAFHLGPQFIVTSSLTKAYGLSGLRCGWILAEPDLAHRIWRLNDLFCNIPAHIPERLSVLALERLPQIADRARALLAANSALLEKFLDARNDLDVVRPPCGTVVFPRVLPGRKQRTAGGHAGPPLPAGNEPSNERDVEHLCAVLREKYETSVVPGRFFEMPQHIRIGIGGPTADLAEGLLRLSICLDSA